MVRGQFEHGPAKGRRPRLTRPAKPPEPPRRIHGHVIRIPWTDDDGKPARVRWWRGLTRGGWRGVGSLWRPLLPLAAIVIIPTGLATLALFNGPFVIAMVLFSPFASLLLVIAFSLVLGVATAGRRVVGESLARLRLAGECPSCGYPLEPEPAPAPSRCPECGSAWRVGEEPPAETVVVRLATLDPRGEASPGAPMSPPPTKA